MRRGVIRVKERTQGGGRLHRRRVVSSMLAIKLVCQQCPIMVVPKREAKERSHELRAVCFILKSWAVPGVLVAPSCSFR